MNIKHITLNNFRCFTQQNFNVDKPIVLVHGKNGAGKTSLLEALHYSCYLKSFRTHLHKDLINLNDNHFFIKVCFNVGDAPSDDVVQVGYAQAEGKIVKLNGNPIQTYKDLIEHYRIVSLTADDIELVSGTPVKRRDFLNSALFLQDLSFYQLLKDYKNILAHRNSLLMKIHHYEKKVSDELLIWSQKLWEYTKQLQEKRIAYLLELELAVNTMLTNHFSTSEEHLQIGFSYNKKKVGDEELFQDFWNHYQTSSLQQEYSWRRTLFGAHLDDFSISFQNKHARIFASRGQQKLIAFLIKVAQLRCTIKSGSPAVLLLDDFLTDFDDQRIKCCIEMLILLDVQLFITIPVMKDRLFDLLPHEDTCLIEL